MMCIGVAGQSAIVKATSATLTFSAESRSVTVGDTFYVVLILDSGENIGGFEGYISYDSSLVEFVSGGKYVNGGDGLLRINDVNSADAQSTKKYSLEFKAKKTGECTFDTSEAPAIYDENGDELSVSSNKLSITIGNSKKLARNNNLSKLLISPGELNQEFSNDITAYKTEVPYENDMLFISAVPEDENAVVSIEGNEGLKVGINYVHVIVTAPSGDKKDIQIEVNRLAEKQENEEEEQEVNGISIKKDDTEQYVIKDKHTYTVAKLEDESLIPEGYEASTILIEGEEIPAYVLSGHLDSEFLLIYLTNDKGNSDFYQYDRIEKTIQRFAGGKLTDKIEVPEPEEAGSGFLSSEFFIMAAMAGIIIVLVIALVVVIMKSKKDNE